jgi:hypothetical protein
LQQDDQILFEKLRNEIAATMKRTNPGVSSDLSDWKGDTITDFQEDLRIKAGGTLSEKWFYTHMKRDFVSMPRIDALNLLCRYVGYSNWDEFRYRNAKITSARQGSDLKKANRVFITIPLVILVLMLLLLAAYRMLNTRSYVFTFTDAETGDPIINTKIQADLLLPGETPLSHTSDSSGSVTIRTNQSTIRLAVSAPSYYRDTIVRVVKKFNRNELVRLKPDPYAMMISYLSASDVKGWMARREQLDSIISDNAVICRMPGPGSNSITELYNKEEFIDKLTMPSSGLRNIKIISTRYENNRIVLLKFMNDPKAR